MNEDLNTPVYSFWPLFLAIGMVLIATGIVSVFGNQCLRTLAAGCIGYRLDLGKPCRGKGERK